MDPDFKPKRTKKISIRDGSAPDVLPKMRPMKFAPRSEEDEVNNVIELSEIDTTAVDEATERNSDIDMSEQTKKPKNRKTKILLPILLTLIVVGLGIGAYSAYKIFSQPTTEELLDQHLKSEGVDEATVVRVREYAIENEINLNSDLKLAQTTTSDKPSDNRIQSVMVPVAELYSTLRDIPADYQGDDVEFISISELTPDQTLLSIDGQYYLDDFAGGAKFSELTIDGDQAGLFDGFNASDTAQLNTDNVFSMNTTGVTALTRRMMNDLNRGVQPTFFSDAIGEFLGSSDITHVSNEVSFLEGCSYSNTLFCSPPEFIETLKASGVDVVELTGNHNNDLGSQANTTTINQYNELGWAHVGGGLNNEDAAKPYIVERDGTKFGMLAYNYPDAPNGGAISGVDKAGANAYSDEKMKSDIAALKPQVDFVQVNIQFWECYAYPDGYVEFPECDYPTGEQEPIFKSVIDAGADMVVGSSAHQPQTYEKYNDGWIYYGLGNLYFEQTQWPGTERGLVLTNYYHSGQLLQTRITPTVYGSDFQTRKMTTEESDYLLGRLNAAR